MNPTYLIVHDDSGEIVKDSFPSEEAAYKWLTNEITNREISPLDINAYSIEKEEEDY